MSRKVQIVCRRQSSDQGDWLVAGPGLTIDLNGDILQTGTFMWQKIVLNFRENILGD